MSGRVAYDYSSLLASGSGDGTDWREYYRESESLAWNLYNILECTILLPHDFYDLIATYFLLPSALCRNIPYLFLYGQSGSGKSTVAKVGSYLHGCSINSSSDTFAGIRNDLDKRRSGWTEVYDPEAERMVSKSVERNICMVWDDVDGSVFVSSPDLYRLFKFGSNKSTDKIILSSKEVGENLEFHCFCPKIFSSISPLHLDDRFKELKRRLIVIPCKRVEELSDERKQELEIEPDTWSSKLIDLDAVSWTGFADLFAAFWDMPRATAFVKKRTELSQSARGLTSQQRAISLDLLACGLASGIWQDNQQALDRLKAYWNWFKGETEQTTGLDNLIKDLIKQEEKNAVSGGRGLEIPVSYLRSQIDMWVIQGWLYERPKPSVVKETMLELGLRNYQGKWVKG